MEDTTKYSVSWGAYQNSICNGLSALQQRGDFVDMTLAADGHHVKVHQMVLSLVSPYIKALITSAACPHPVIFLNKVSYQTLQSILQYAYTGEVVVSNDKIQEFLNACKDLHIRGLEECMNNFESNEERSLNSPQMHSPHTLDKDETQVLDTSVPETLDFYDDNYAINDDDDDDDDDNDMSSQFDNNEELLKTVKNIKPTSTIAQTAATTLKYTVSNMNTIQIVLNRYLYCFKNVRKINETVWKCINYVNPKRNNRDKCRARIVVRDNKVVSRSCAHNHPYHDAQILKRLRNRNMFTTINEVQRAIDVKKKELKSAETNISIKEKKKAGKADSSLISFDD